MYDNFNDLQMYENFYLQKKREEQQDRDLREIEKERSKVAIRGEGQMNMLDYRTKKRHEEDEYKRSLFEKLEVNADGKIVVTTHSQEQKFQPREISDMRNPKFYVAARASNLSETIFVLDCELAGANKLVYFSPKCIQSGTYILGQLATAGITILASSAKAKEYARNLLALLVKSGIPTVIPDEPGWMELKDEKFTFVKEERMTWEKISELV